MKTSLNHVGMKLLTQNSTLQLLLEYFHLAHLIVQQVRGNATPPTRLLGLSTTL